ncbi:MAG: hypothetical protein O2960_12440 [Verrucomicrobia bacterium]|nr:hypothetical protein [Verrucomicrobiota bacterium]
MNPFLSYSAIVRFTEPAPAGTGTRSVLPLGHWISTASIEVLAPRPITPKSCDQ